MISEFFRPLVLEIDEDDDDDEETTKDNSDGLPIPPFIVPSVLSSARDSRTTWNRDPLFNSMRGEIGLAWSIFKVCGTPTEDNWPVCHSMRSSIQLG
jgi:hypothetical protein